MPPSARRSQSRSTWPTRCCTPTRDNEFLPTGKEFLVHESVNNSIGEYVRGRVTTNKLENYFSQLKRSIDGTHHHVSPAHLHRYLAEFDYRYSTRKLSDKERTARLLGRVGGKRLTYKPLRGNA